MFNDYENFCFEATKDDEVFSKFKRDPKYTKILEHVSFDLGQKCFELIPELYIEKLQKNYDEDIGCPRKFKYGRFFITPTLLRYLKVLVDIEDIFETLDNLNVVEIGAGYGGQFIVLDSFFNIKKYTLIDLPGPCKLIEKYLSLCPNIKSNYEIRSDIKEGNYDFVISNYAFSELSKSTQTEYLNKIITKSKSGYLILNTEQGYSYKELLSVIKNSEIYRGFPFTGKNYLLIW